MSLKISNEVKAVQKVPIKPSKDYNIVFLKEVKTDEVAIEKGEKKGEMAVCLFMTFVLAKDTSQEFEKRFFPLDIPSENANDKTKEDFNKAFDVLVENLKHVTNVYVPGVETEAAFGSHEDFAGLFKSIADYFNGVKRNKKGDITNAEDAKPIFRNENGKPILVWLKLVYPQKNDYVSLPYRPNWIERAVEGQLPKTLTWNPNFDFDIPQKREKPTVGGVTGGVAEFPTGSPSDDIDWS